MSLAVSVEFARDVSPDGFEGFLLALRSLLIPAQRLGRPWRAAIELTGDRDGVRFEVWVERDQILPSVAQALRAAFPTSRVTETPVRDFDPEDMRGVGRLSLGRSDAPLRTDLAQPGLAGILTTLGSLHARQTAVVQIVLAPAAAGAQTRLLNQARAQERHGSRQPLGQAFATTQANRPRARATREKATTPLLHTGVLIAASDGHLVRDLAAGFAQFAAPYAHVRYHRPLWTGNAHRQLRARALPFAFPAPTLVGTGELAAMLAPTAAVLRANRGPVLDHRVLAPPAEAPRRGRVLCISDVAGRSRPVAISRIDARTHIALIGPTGTGKTTAQTNLVLQAIEAGDGAIYLEPKGDAIEETLRRIPPERQDDVIVIDPVADPDHPVGLNLLQGPTGGDPAATAASLVAVLRELNRPNYWGARLEDTAYNGLLTAASVPGTTIAELPAIYAAEPYRRKFLQAIEDPYVREFWGSYDRLSEGEQAQITAPVLNRLRPLLRPALLPIIGQAKSTIDLDEILRDRKILLVRLPPEGQLFGALLVARLWQAIQRRTRLPESQRRDVMLAIDEVHSFLRTGADVADMLALARSLHVSLCLATQHLDQCPPTLRAALLANARTRLIFQTNHPDASTLAQGLTPHLEAADLTGLGRYEVAARIAINGTTTEPFTARTLPLPTPVSRSSRPLRERSAQRYARPRDQVLKDIRDRLSTPVSSTAFGEEVGRRAR